MPWGSCRPTNFRRPGMHLAACRRCRQLADIAQGKTDLLQRRSREAMAEAILRRTSGPVCERARDRLRDFAEGEMSPAESEVLSMHLGLCRTCSEVLAVLVELRSRLPRMAELDPSRGFTGDVMAALAGQRGPLQDWRRWVGGFLPSIIRRPRFAWEAAYLGALVLLLVIGNPALMSMDAARPLREAGSMGVRKWEMTTHGVTVLRSASAVHTRQAAACLAETVSQGSGNAVAAWRTAQERLRVAALVALNGAEDLAGSIANGLMRIGKDLVRIPWQVLK